jgi:microcystin-dependent protein
MITIDGSANTISLLPAGEVCYFAMGTAPTGFLKANGAAVSRTTYSDLFAAIGTTFGVGDGSTTFALPDLRGEFLRGWDDARGVDSGRVFGSAQGDLLEDHFHTAYGASSGAGGSGGGLESGPYAADARTSSVGSAGVAGTETRPRNVALLACIRF